METNIHRSEFEDDLLVQRLGQVFKEARENGKMHVDVDKFHKCYGEPEPNATLEVLKKQGVKKGIIGIDNKQIRPTPLGIKRCKLDSSFYS